MRNCKVLLLLFRGWLVSRSNLILENLVLRQQLTVQQRKIKRPKLKRKDRIFWIWLSRIWPQWKSALIIVKPETVIKWHRQGFKLYWRWKSQSHKVARPRISKEIQDLIRRISRENRVLSARLHEIVHFCWYRQLCRQAPLDRRLMVRVVWRAGEADILEND